MGITLVAALKASVFLLAFYFLRGIVVIWITFPILYASIGLYLVAFSSHPAVNCPLLLGKNCDGKFPFWSILIFCPFFLLVWIFVPLRRWKLKEPLYSKVVEGLYVGGWPSSSDKLPPGTPAVIDCTCELPKRIALSKNAYLSIAVWDTRSPSTSQIEYAVHWACKRRAQGIPIYIHCAYGHGRSICVMCALLVALGLAKDWKSALKIIQEKRPYTRVNKLHQRSLDEWSKGLLSSKEN